ncbi:MAG TPA: hypothetical protein VGJ66_07655 [Pyrinomonadaceae bacterium]
MTRAKKAQQAVLVGAATGAAEGAVSGAADAGSKVAGIDADAAREQSLQQDDNGTAE